MVLGYARGWENLPKNVKILSKEEALAHQQRLIWTWENPSEVFFLKYGSLIAGFVTSMASIPIVQHFRKQFKLAEFGKLTTYMPALVMPSLLTYFGYSKLVTSEIILMKMQCPLCMQFRYAAYHICTSLCYSTILTALSVSSVSFARKTRYVPPPQSEGKQYMKLIWDVVKSGARKYQITTACQLVIILFLPYLQVQEFSKLRESVEEKERIRYGLEKSIDSET